METEWKRLNVSQGILIINQKVLLVRNDYGASGLLWSLPGGRLEPGEQHEAALIREFKEETGLDVLADELLYINDARTERFHSHFVSCVFTVKLAPHLPLDANGEPLISCEEDSVVKQVHFVPITEVVQYISLPSLGEGLINYLYYGNTHMPKRYWCYPEYYSSDLKPLTWPPTPQ
jgi:8-oxo-dGTP diphosphatase